MSFTSSLRLGSVLAVLLAAPVVQALGPVDGEVTALYWFSTTDVAGVEEDSPDVGARAELWFKKKLGISAAVLRADPEGVLSGTELEYRNLDVKWRLLSPTENSFLAAGLGWQQVDVGSEDTSGPRAVLDARLGLINVLYLYGRGAYFPDLDDVSVGGATLSDGDGHELEVGIQFKPAPFLQLFAGYRVNAATFESPVGSVDIDTDGAVAGIGINF